MNTSGIKRGEKAYKRKCPDENLNPSFANVDNHQDSFNPSVLMPLDKCLFCNEGSEKGELHNVTSVNVDRQIRETVALSNNETWQAILSLPDAITKYHLYCYVKHVQRASKSPTTTSVPQLDEQMHQIAVNTEFCSIVKNMLTKGTYFDILICYHGHCLRHLWKTNGVAWFDCKLYIQISES